VPDRSRYSAASLRTVNGHRSLPPEQSDRQHPTGDGVSSGVLFLAVQYDATEAGLRRPGHGPQGGDGFAGVAVLRCPAAVDGVERSLETEAHRGLAVDDVDAGPADASTSAVAHWSRQGFFMAQRSLFRRAGYAFLRWLARLIAVACYRIRYRGRAHIPATGSAVVCSNHQSFFDPIFVGTAFNRRLNYLARKSLFGGPLGWLLQFLDSIPIDREGFNLGAVKETLTRLKRGEMVLMFPEGTRSPDGRMQPLKSGFVPLVRRSRAILLPVALDGAYQAWPRRARWPRMGRVQVCIGEPISPEEVAAMDDEALLAELERRMRDCLARAQAALRC
jgi:1-acyl-sn-glycerol-3-phosphate acyltransferase